MSLLELSAVEKRFGATVALAGVDLGLDAGEVHALIGENGAGKSTLLNILAGAYPPDGGAMRLSGEPYAPRGPADARRLGIAHIHQELSLCLDLSVAENILMGAEPAEYGWIARERLVRRAAGLLEDFGSDSIDPRSRTGDLPLAQQQIVEICRALAWNARVLLMDEPTSPLQRPQVERLFGLIRRLRDRGIAVLYVSHFLEEIREIADRCTVLRDGKSVGSAPISSVSDRDLIARMVGREVEAVYEREARPRGAPGNVLLEVRELAAPPLLKSASLELRAGEILGIAGLIGSGRTELVRCLFGLSHPAAGRIRLRGRELPLSGLGSSRQISRGVGYLSEDRKGEGLALRLSIADNVTMSRLSSCASAGWIALDRQKEQAEGVMRRLRVRAPGARAAVFRLSGGNQQKVALGRLLHQDPDVLLLDEPARGIDISSKAEIYREIEGLAARGKAILMVSSYLPELLALCDSIAVMTRGRLSPALAASQWTPDEIMRVAVGGAA